MRSPLAQAVAAALTEMMGYPVTLLQPGGRPAAGGDPMAISVPLAAGAGIRASLSLRSGALSTIILSRPALMLNAKRPRCGCHRHLTGAQRVLGRECRCGKEFGLCSTLFYLQARQLWMQWRGRGSPPCACASSARRSCWRWPAATAAAGRCWKPSPRRRRRLPCRCASSPCTLICTTCSGGVDLLASWHTDSRPWAGAAMMCASPCCAFTSLRTSASRHICVRSAGSAAGDVPAGAGHAVGGGLGGSVLQRRSARHRTACSAGASAQAGPCYGIRPSLTVCCPRCWRGPSCYP